MNILICEDDRSIAAMIQRVLQPLDAHVFKVTSFADLLHSLTQIKFDVICLDLGLPDSPTYETLAKIKTLKMSHPQTAIMVITGQPMIDNEKALAAGADGFLQKEDAFHRGVLIQRISSIISKVCRPDSQLDHQMALAKQATENTIQELK